MSTPLNIATDSTHTDGALPAALRNAADAVETLGSRADGLRRTVPAAVARAASEADALARRGVEKARDAGRMVRQRASEVGDTTVGYIKDEPVKAVLMAAAVGAVAAALIGWVTRSRADRG